ncbi:MAG TPA: ABC transporter ATP-binding protein [Hypericibacter adhaerens]|jgi:simple sugar transport system ATP-binding protein|uniref:Sugar ABC transporter n=1 Tax=Hypericibacter adhaerens TaxID=2602016 RepID=A0A5J6N2G6_9PROT|nr:ABC transporter ATP-binding protein [Hypericibacter adhaerens]QEX23931.1 sugar ABC transporter [Hypericibacter adhaerens]HWA44541.1 ABC transporter ATP-binding protein [Hypericibacter adhaerens]
MSEATPGTAVSVRNVTKRFPGVVANDDVSIDFLPGEIHVLLGENGAGKSTLIGMLAGMQQPDSGEILVKGRPVRIGSPRGSLDLGIGTVFQHVLLVPTLSVIENLMLGGSRWRLLDRAPVLKRFQELSDLLGVRLDPDALVGRLALGEQQQVEIMRALWRGENVLILDEPTSMLTPQGVQDLGKVMKRLRDKGVAIIFITHKLAEAYEFGDRISVLRLGRVAGQLDKARLKSMTEAQITDEVLRLMFGGQKADSRDAETLLGRGGHLKRQARADRSKPPILAVKGVSTLADRGECPLVEVSFELWPGEVLGVAGVDGNGQKHLAEMLAGQRPAASGSIQFEGRDVTHEGVAQRRRHGFRYITDERLGEGTVGAFSVATNLVVKEIGVPPLWQRGVSRWDLIHGHAREQIKRHDIRTPSERTPIGRLSGGNIQKALLARELNGSSRLAIFNKPTYGLDLHNIRLARDRIAQCAEQGLAVILISNELDELLELSDRIAVMFRGRLSGVVPNEGNAERRIGLLMTGAEAA